MNLRPPQASQTMRRCSNTSVTGRPDTSKSRISRSRRSWTLPLGVPQPGQHGRHTADSTRTTSRSGASTTTPSTLTRGSHSRTDTTSRAIEALQGSALSQTPIPAGPRPLQTDPQPTLIPKNGEGPASRHAVHRPRRAHRHHHRRHRMHLRDASQRQRHLLHAAAHLHARLARLGHHRPRQRSIEHQPARHLPDPAQRPRRRGHPDRQRRRLRQPQRQPPRRHLPPARQLHHRSHHLHRPSRRQLQPDRRRHRHRTPNQLRRDRGPRTAYRLRPRKPRSHCHRIAC